MLSLGIEIKSATDSVGHQVLSNPLWGHAVVSLVQIQEMLGMLTGAQRTASFFATMNLFRDGSRACGISSKNNVFAAQSNCL
jgi:hypothetical protein